MIGIYKIVNKLNNKVYIGQSNDILRRFNEHKNRNVIQIDKAIQTYGVDNFSFEILEECELEELELKEKYYITLYDSIVKGYNVLPGGSSVIGENNGNAKVSEEDVKIIRQAYNEHQPQKKIYEQFKNKISFSSFQAIWQGQSWQHIMPEVFTPENKNYYIKQNSIGEKGSSSIFSDEEVLTMRQRYVNESAKEIYKDYQNRASYQTIQKLLWGNYYRHLPIYSKKSKQWINK